MCTKPSFPCRLLLTKGNSGPLTGRGGDDKTSSVSLHVEPHLHHTEVLRPRWEERCPYLNDAAPPGDARLALPLLPAGKPFLLAAVVGASGGRGSRLLTGPRQRAVPVGDAAAGAVKADSPAAASAVPVASPEGHLALQRPRGAGQPPAAAAAAELRHQLPGCSSAAPRSPSPLPQPLLGGAAPSAFWVFTSRGGSAKVSLHRAFGTEIASLQEGGRGGGRLGAVSVSTSARSVSPSAPGKGKEAKRDGLLSHAVAAAGERYTAALTHTHTHTHTTHTRARARGGPARSSAPDKHGHQPRGSQLGHLLLHRVLMSAFSR